MTTKYNLTREISQMNREGYPTKVIQTAMSACDGFAYIATAKLAMKLLNDAFPELKIGVNTYTSEWEKSDIGGHFGIQYFTALVAPAGKYQGGWGIKNDDPNWHNHIILAHINPTPEWGYAPYGLELKMRETAPTGLFAKDPALDWAGSPDKWENYRPDHEKAKQIFGAILFHNLDRFLSHERAIYNLQGFIAIKDSL